MLERIPAEDHIDLVLAFARVPPTIDAYEVIAREHGLEVVRGEWASEDFRCICGPAFGLMMLDGTLARLHCVSLLQEDEIDPTIAEVVGVPSTQSCDVVRDVFARLRTALANRLGPPSQEKTWTATCILDEQDHDFSLAAWSFEHTVLVLLRDGFGDFHVGEVGAVDLRIVPRSAAAGLPDSVRGLLDGVPLVDWFSKPRESR